MSDVRVHIATALPPEHLERIRAVLPRLQVTYHPYIVQERPAGMEQHLADVEVLLTYHAGFQMADAPRLRWVQLAGDGVDYLLGRPIMASDVLPGMGPARVVGNHINISLHPSSKAEADRVFAALAEGGTVTMPLADQFWGDYFGSFVDRYGVPWMINTSSQSA